MRTKVWKQATWVAAGWLVLMLGGTLASCSSSDDTFELTITNADAVGYDVYASPAGDDLDFTQESFVPANGEAVLPERPFGTYIYRLVEPGQPLAGFAYQREITSEGPSVSWSVPE